MPIVTAYLYGSFFESRLEKFLILRSCHILWRVTIVSRYNNTKVFPFNISFKVLKIVLKQVALAIVSI